MSFARLDRVHIEEYWRRQMSCRARVGRRRLPVNPVKSLIHQFRNMDGRKQKEKPHLT